MRTKVYLYTRTPHSSLLTPSSHTSIITVAFNLTSRASSPIYVYFVRLRLLHLPKPNSGVESKHRIEGKEKQEVPTTKN